MQKLAYTSEQKYDGYLKVNNCGKQWTNDREFYDTVKENGRIDYSIHYISKGVGYCEIDGTVYPIPEGSLVLYYPKVRQHYSFKKKDAAVMMWSHFSGTACDMLKKYISSPAIVIEIQDRKQFEAAFEKMIISYYKKDVFSDSICEGYMTVLLSLIAQSSIRSTTKSSKISNENLEKVLSYMHLNFNKPINIKEYAKICCVGEDHFIRVFKAYTGLPPYNYQLKIRITRAIAMLENTPITISECAEAVGFSDTAYFSKIFKKFTGHPPSYYKK